jgi:hypothetical protein
MKITDAQLDQYIDLYKQEFGEELERVQALTQCHKLINLVLYLAYPELTVQTIEQVFEKEYTQDATHKEIQLNDLEFKKG